MVTSLGESLREAREARGVSLDAVARDTRISRRYLDALESGDLDALPGGAFDTGYIRSYASFLGVDPAPFLKAYAAEKGPSGEEELIGELNRLVPQRAPARSWKRILTAGFLLVVLGLGLVALAVWWPGAPETASDEMPPEPATLKRDQRASTVPTPPPPPPAPAPEPERELANSESTASAPESSGLRVPSYGVGTGVVDRNLVGRSDRFEEGSEVWFWTRVVGGEEGDLVRHVWTHEGRLAMAADLEVGASHWRTYSRLVLPPGATGRWVVEARSADGRTLARVEFDCVRPPT